MVSYSRPALIIELKDRVYCNLSTVLVVQHVTFSIRAQFRGSAYRKRFWKQIISFFGSREFCAFVKHNFTGQHGIVAFAGETMFIVNGKWIGNGFYIALGMGGPSILAGIVHVAQF